MVRAAALAALIASCPMAALAQFGMGGWVVEETSDAMTDAKTIQAIVLAGGASLQVNCQVAGKRRLYVAVITKEHLGEGVRPLSYRVGEAPAKSAGWSYRRSEALLLDQVKAKGVAADLASGQPIRVRAQTYDRRYLDFEFSGDNAAPAISAVRQACGAS